MRLSTHMGSLLIAMNVSEHTKHYKFPLDLPRVVRRQVLSRQVRCIALLFKKPRERIETPHRRSSGVGAPRRRLIRTGTSNLAQSAALENLQPCQIFRENTIPGTLFDLKRIGGILE